MERRQKLKRNWIGKFHTFLARLIDAILWLSTDVKVAISSRKCSTSYRSSMFFSQEAQSGHTVIAKHLQQVETVSS
jgi:hypothetical protein